MMANWLCASTFVRNGLRFVVGAVLISAVFERSLGAVAFIDCPGDCDGDRVVTVDELVVGVQIALNRQDAIPCLAFDLDGDGDVAVDEVIRAIDAVLAGCSPQPSPTPTPIVPGGTAFSLIETLSDGDRVRGLTGARSIAVSTDGKNVYVGSEAPDGGIVIFRRDPSTGSLSFMDFVGSDTNGFAGLKFVRDIAIESDGNHLYATTLETELQAFERDQDGRLAPPTQTSSRPTSGASVSTGPDGNVYVASIRYGLAVFGHVTPGVIDIVQEEAVGRSIAPTKVIVGPDGNSVYVLGWIYPPAPLTSYEITLFRRDSLTAPLERIEMATSGEAPEISRPISGVISPDGRNLYVARRFVHSPVTTFQRSAEDARLSLVSDTTWAADLGVPTAMCQAPNGSTVFVSGIGPQGQGRIATFHRDSGSGALQLVDLYRHEDFGGILSTTACATSPDGETLYVTDGAGSLSGFSLTVDE